MFGPLPRCMAWTGDALDLRVCLLHQSPSGRMSIFAQVHLLPPNDNDTNAQTASTARAPSCPCQWVSLVPPTPRSGGLLGFNYCPLLVALEALSGLLGHQLRSFELKSRPLVRPVGSRASEEQMDKSKLTNGPPTPPTPHHHLGWKEMFLLGTVFSRNANPERSRPMLIWHSVWTRLH